MSSKTTNPKHVLSAKEMETLALSYTCMDKEPTIDYVKLAQLLGYANHRSASNAMIKIRNKLKEAAENVGSNKAKPTAAGGKRKAVEMPGGENEEVDVAPAKKRRGRSATSVKKEEVGMEDEDDEDEA
ncbi:hypothetical protein PG990_001206 [Apiospora arundinis]|uniref:Uncharacterized protein n=1 Tax=Apiospora arundinis TaxID=335852 RepID=A0ABR2I1Y6_9PEZI